MVSLLDTNPVSIYFLLHLHTKKHYMIGFTPNRQDFGNNNRNLIEHLVPACVGLFVLDFRPASKGEYTNVDGIVSPKNV
jgi:hypothetical protein